MGEGGGPTNRHEQCGLMVVLLPLTGRFDGRDKETQKGYDFIIRTGLIPPTEVPSPGAMEPSCRLRVMPVVMPVMVSQPAGAKTDQREETSTQQDAGCRQRHQH